MNTGTQEFEAQIVNQQSGYQKEGAQGQFDADLKHENSGHGQNADPDTQTQHQIL